MSFEQILVTWDLLLLRDLVAKKLNNPPNDFFDFFLDQIPIYCNFLMVKDKIKIYDFFTTRNMRIRDHISQTLIPGCKIQLSQMQNDLLISIIINIRDYDTESKNTTVDCDRMNIIIKEFIRQLQLEDDLESNNQKLNYYTLNLERHLAIAICYKNNIGISLLNHAIKQHNLTLDKDRIYENLYYAEYAIIYENVRKGECMISELPYDDIAHYEMWCKYSHLI